MLDTFLGLPLHPLMVHAAVVLVPLAALGVIALAFVRQWRERFAVAVLGILVVGAGAAVLSKFSGERFAERVGLPADHERFADAFTVATLIFLVVAGLWLWWVRRDADHDAADRRKDLAGWVAAALAVVVLGLAGLAGHSGATAAWSDVVAAPAVSSTPSTPGGTEQPSASGSTAPPPTSATTAAPSTSQGTEATSSGYTMADVEQHNTADSCWVSINGSVYDVTDWIPQHPGGPQRIIPLCGTDATADFTTQHQGERLPAENLARFLLGPLEG